VRPTSTTCTRPSPGPPTQIGIDTGRRPEDILALPVDCLQHDKDGSPVLIYNNAKADRLARRLPITQATAAVITEQQERVRARFPEPRSVSSNCCPLRGATPMGAKPSRWTRSRAGTVNGSPGGALCGAATAPNSTTTESSSMPTGTPTLSPLPLLSEGRSFGAESSRA
jgi:hypothetical protein